MCVLLCICFLKHSDTVWLCWLTRDVVLVSRLSQDALTSQSRLFTSCAQDVIFDRSVQATLIKGAKSVVAIYCSVNLNRLMHYLLMEVSGWWRHGFDVLAYFNVSVSSRDLQTSCVGLVSKCECLVSMLSRLVRPTSRSHLHLGL